MPASPPFPPLRTDQGLSLPFPSRKFIQANDTTYIPVPAHPINFLHPTTPHDMSGFQFPSFGFRSTTDQQGYGSPKNFSTPVYQPMPAVGTPSFGGLGRPLTPKETSRHSSHSSYSSKDAEPVVQPLPPSVERARRHRDYYLEGGDIYFLVRFLASSRLFPTHFLISAL